ncbi:MAG: hypothetical protein ACRDFR_00965, partial [Candidatus Limnocylindria bacterium]
MTTADVLDEAIRRWLSGRPSPEPQFAQGLWLAILGNRPDLIATAAADSLTGEMLDQAAVATFQCDPTSSSNLDELAGADRRTPLFWQLRIRESARLGHVDKEAVRLVELILGSVIESERAHDALNPLRESGFSTDVWGYRRVPIRWPDPIETLPSPGSAEVRWLLDPVGAIRAAGLDDRLPNC